VVDKRDVAQDVEWERQDGANVTAGKE